MKDDTQTMKALYIRHRALPGKREEVLRIWETYARDYVDRAEGQVVYVYGFDETDPDAVIAYQLFTDNAGTDGFTSQPWYEAYQAETAALLAGPSEFRSIAPQWIKRPAN